MKKIILLIFILSIGLSVFSQKIDTLPTQKEAFSKALVNLLNETKRTELKDLTKSFNGNIKKGLYTDDFYSDLATITNKMILMRGKAYPQISGVLKSFMEMNTLNLDPTKWDEWLGVLDQTMTHAKKGDTKTTLKFLDFAYSLYKNNSFFEGKAKTWLFKADKFKLRHTENGPIVELGLSKIVGFTKGDTIVIQNTIGTYSFYEQKWYGLHGAIDWTRAGLPRKEVFCTFGEYQINMSTQAYTVDSVIFTYKNYFSEEIKGSLHDKLITNNDPSKTNYPKFSAKNEDVPVQEIAENVIYKGGFTLSGAKILGQDTEGEKSSLTIYKPGTKQKIAFASFYNITINKPEKVSVSDAEVSIYFGEDSIYHPRISMIYNLNENMMRLIKGEGSLASTKFWDSYHNVEFDADIIEWDTNEDDININTVSTSGMKPAIYESKDFFNKSTMRALRGNVSYDPLSILMKYQKQNFDDEIFDEDYAKLINPNLTVKQIQALLFSLIQEGFISWNKESGTISIKDKVKHYVKANAKKKDSDNIRLISKTKKQNGVLNLKTNEIQIEGVDIVPISQSTSTVFRPDSFKLKLKQNRNMEFNGFFSCGRMDFFGNNNEFIYEGFTMNIPDIDTLIIYIPDGDEMDKYGNPRLKPLNTTIENLTGTIEINDNDNKSGRIDKPEFPKLHSTSASQIFFDSKNIRSATYKRDNFFYELTPFDLDSLDHLQPSNIEFQGELHSADIFPIIKEPIRIQSDLSLGFTLESPPSGFDIYKGRAKFVSDITLNGEGLKGDGQIDYRTISFESSDIQFFPDSLLATTDTLGVEKSKGAYESPWVRSANNDIKFFPYQDSLWANSSSKSPFRMYGEIMDLDGTFSITGKGITGTGTADWDDATLISNHFIFEADEMFADTAELIIKNLDNGKVTFNTPNVNAAVDFIKNTGYFKSNLTDNRTEFGENQYETNIDEFFWDIDNKKLEFNAKEGSAGAPFKSLHKDQDSIAFLVKKAYYNLATSIIEAHGVEEILVADSRIIPDSGKVVINPQAKISALKHAVIEASAETKKHIIENAIIQINGKNNIKATGDYIYKTRDTEAQMINFPSIGVVLADSSLITKKRKNKEKVYAINGTGKIDKDENFILYPNVNFYGSVQMFSTYDKLKIKGFTKIDFKSEFVRSDFYEIDSEVDPENLQMNVSKAKDPGGAVVRTGIFVSKSGLNPIYTEILNNQIGPMDIPMMETNGILSHNYDKGTYTFGSQEKIDHPETIQAGNVLEFNPATGEINAAGLLDLGTQYGVIQEKVAGSVKANLNDEQYSFNTTISFPLSWDKDLLEKISYYFFEDNFGADDADYSKVSQQMQLAEFYKPKDLKKVITEIETSGIYTKPKSFKENFLVSDVDLYYDNEQRAYKSKGKFNLTFVGERSIHKRVKGYIELGHRMGSDYYSIFLKTTLGDWLYINFDGGATDIQVISSYEDINRLVEGLDMKKRTIKGENKDQFIVYGICSESKAKQFEKRMKAYGLE
jgi:hypothetical protein